jgi:hypothetical protein
MARVGFMRGALDLASCWLPWSYLCSLQGPGPRRSWSRMPQQPDDTPGKKPLLQSSFESQLV